MFLFSPYFSFQILRISAELTHLSVLHSFKVLLHKMWSKELQRGCYLEFVKNAGYRPQPRTTEPELALQEEILVHVAARESPL